MLCMDPPAYTQSGPTASSIMRPLNIPDLEQSLHFSGESKEYAVPGMSVHVPVPRYNSASSAQKPSAKELDNISAEFYDATALTKAALNTITVHNGFLARCRTANPGMGLPPTIPVNKALAGNLNTQTATQLNTRRDTHSTTQTATQIKDNFYNRPPALPAMPRLCQTETSPAKHQCELDQEYHPVHLFRSWSVVNGYQLRPFLDHTAVFRYHRKPAVELPGSAVL